MKILFVSYAFYPQIGGLESVSEMLAREFTNLGHQVCLVTQTPGNNTRDFPFRVVRRPSPVELLHLTRWCDVMFHNNISLQAAWPLLIMRRPWVIAHHTWIPAGGGLRGVKGYIKHWAVRRARCISISQAVADHVKTPSVIIPNPYDSAIFRRFENVERHRDLVFVGRLVSDKGVDVLLDALCNLKNEHGLNTFLTVVGDGPEFEALNTQADNLGIGSMIKFTGCLSGAVLAGELNSHAIMVVPSQWNEPFGIVALEGIACGCVVVASDGGGLPDAVGPCGAIFPRGDSHALAGILANLLSNNDMFDKLLAGAASHLGKHQIHNVASSYLGVMERAVRDYSCH